MGIDWEIKNLASALLSMGPCGTDIGLDIRIREGEPTEFHLYSKEEDLPENTDDDEIARLEKKLELLEQIRKMQDILEKFIKEHPGFEPIKYPDPYVPYNPPYTPWTPVQPPTIWYKSETADDTANWLTELLNGEY